MEDEPAGIEVCLIHPWELSEADWFEIAKEALKVGEMGETSYLKCAVLGYLQWGELDSIKARKH